MKSLLSTFPDTAVGENGSLHAGSGGTEGLWWGVQSLRWHLYMNQGVGINLGSTHWMYRRATVDPPTSLTFSTALMEVEIHRAKHSCPCWQGDATPPLKSMGNLSLPTRHLSPPLPSPLRLFPTVNKHKSCQWYEPAVCIAGTTSNIFKIKSLYTGRGLLLECVAFCFSRKIRKPEFEKKINE